MSIKTPSSARRGFSLLELLLVLTLAPIVFFTLYSNFSAGLRLWATVTRQTPEEDTAIFLHKVRRDVENMMRSDAVPFGGDREETVFASSIQAPAGLGGAHGIGEVRLYYDASSRTVRREVRDYSQIHRDAPGQTSILLQGVSSFSFSYWVLQRTGGYEWEDSWTPEAGLLPSAVRLSFSTERSSEARQWVLVVPVGGKGP